MEQERAEELVARYTDMLLRIGYTWLGDLDDAQDVCQMALIKAWEADRSFPSPQEEKAWMIRVAVNLCKDWKKSAWVRRRARLEEGVDLAAAPPPEGGMVELVQTLPLKYRQVVYLRYFEGYQVQEIAGLLGVAPAAVSNRLSRARRKLKQLCEEGAYETIL